MVVLHVLEQLDKMFIVAFTYRLMLGALFKKIVGKPMNL